MRFWRNVILSPRSRSLTVAALPPLVIFVSGVTTIVRVQPSSVSRLSFGPAIPVIVMPPNPCPPRSPFEPSVLEASGFVVDWGARGAAGAAMPHADADGSVEARGLGRGRQPMPTRQPMPMPMRPGSSEPDGAGDAAKTATRDQDGEDKQDGHPHTEGSGSADPSLGFGHGWSSRWSIGSAGSKRRKRTHARSSSTLVLPVGVVRSAGASGGARVHHQIADHGMTRWTGLPRIVTCQVVRSVAGSSELVPPIEYWIFHQPGSVSPLGTGAM